MCGIAGTLALVPELSAPEAETVEAMTAALRHRGPDARRVVWDGRAALGNARLRVTDLSDAGALPMASADGSLWLAYNGAVTAFRELRRRFRLDSGYRFRSQSDSEVVLRLYEQLGPDFLRELSGMFAFCLYDRRAQKAFLVRDFYGLRPLFYAVTAGRLHFASEIKALLELPGLSRGLDREGLWHFFSLGYFPGASTPFASVRELRGGHLLEADLRRGRFEERRYYRTPYAPDPAWSEPAAAARLHELLLDSVRRNLASDAPAGLTLSGGVDTSSLLALAKELGVSRKLHTFSLKIDEPSFDESRYQRIMVDFARPIHHEIPVGHEEVLENLAASVAHLDEPTANGAAVPTFLLARAARQHVSVLLSGEGGDELFNAYETHRAYRVRLLYRSLAPAWVRRLVRAGAQRLPTSYRKLSLDFLTKRFTEGAELDVPESHFHWRHVLGEAEKARLLRGPRAPAPTSALYSELYHSLDFDDDLNRLSLIDLEYYFIDDLMLKNDRMMMAHSVEARFPYMERDVVEFAARLPTRLRLRGLRGRWIQKRALRGLLPPAIARRSNMGLEMPHSIWFLGPLRGLAERLLAPGNVARTGLLDPEAVRALWLEHLARRRDNGRALWSVLNFLLWFDLFVYEGNFKDYLQGAGGRRHAAPTGPAAPPAPRAAVPAGPDGSPSRPGADSRLP